MSNAYDILTRNLYQILVPYQTLVPVSGKYVIVVRRKSRIYFSLNCRDVLLSKFAK